MKSNLFSWLFCWRRSLGLLEFALAFIILFVLDFVLYDLFFILQALFGAPSLFMQALAYIFPALLAFMTFCVFRQRWRTLTTRHRLITGLILTYVIGTYLKTVGVTFRSIVPLTPDTYNMTPFLDVSFFLGILLVLIYVGLILFALQKPIRSVEGVKPSYASGLVTLGLISCIALCLNFKNPSSQLYEPHHRILKAAQGYDTFAAKILGDRYAVGLGVDKDLQEALKWYQAAYDRHVKDLTYDIAAVYEESGAELQASEWFSKAADKGYDQALQKVGRLEVRAKAAPAHNATECNKPTFNVNACRELAVAGHSEGQFQYAEYLAQTLEPSRIGAYNAVFWYTEAAKKGHSNAAAILCDTYTRGILSRIDINEAANWCNKAAEDKIQYVLLGKIVAFLAKEAK
jgi:hypothetical protein